MFLHRLVWEENMHRNEFSNWSSATSHVTAGASFSVQFGFRRKKNLMMMMQDENKYEWTLINEVLPIDISVRTETLQANALVFSSQISCGGLVCWLAFQKGKYSYLYKNSTRYKRITKFVNLPGIQCNDSVPPSPPCSYYLGLNKYKFFFLQQCCLTATCWS